MASDILGLTPARSQPVDSAVASLLWKDVRSRLGYLLAGVLPSLEAQAAFILASLPATEEQGSPGACSVLASRGLDGGAAERLEVALCEARLRSSGPSLTLIRSLLEVPPPAPVALLPLRCEGKLRAWLFVRWPDGRTPCGRDDALVRAVVAATETLINGVLAADDARSREEETRALVDIAKEISMLGELDRVLSMICQKACELMRAEIAYVALADLEHTEIRMRTTHGIRNPEWLNMRMRFGEGVAGWVAQARQTVILDDYETYEHNTRPDIRAMAAGESIRAVIATPLATGDNILGVLLIADHQPARFSRGDADLLRGLADQAAIAIANSRLYEQERRETAVHEKLTQIALRAGDYSMVCGVLNELFDNPVVLYDRHLNLLACHPPSLMTDHPQVTKSKTRLTRTDHETAPDSPHEAMAREHAWILPSTDAFPLRSAVARAAAGADTLGYVQVLEVNRYLQDHDLRVAERAGITFALHLMRERVQAEVEQRFRGELLTDLLSADSHVVSDAVERFARLGYNRNASWVSLVIRLDLSNRPRTGALVEDETLTATLQSVYSRLARYFSRLGVSFIAAVRKSEVKVILELPPSGPPRYIEQILEEEIARLVSQHGEKYRFIVGYGSTVIGIRDVVNSFEEARLCADIAFNHEIYNQVVEYERIGILGLLLSSGIEERLHHLIELRLGKILDYDLLNRSDLMMTLRCYLQESCNKSAVAGRMHLHMNTIKYRLHRIEEVSGLDLSDHRVRFELQMAAEILAIKAGLRKGWDKPDVYELEDA